MLSGCQVIRIIAYHPDGRSLGTVARVTTPHRGSRVYQRMRQGDYPAKQDGLPVAEWKLIDQHQVILETIKAPGS